MDTQNSTRQRPVAPTLDADLTGRRNMPAGTIFRSALRALSANKLRSSLTMLGMIIGVGAVIAAVTLTQGVSTNINQRFASLGTNIVYVIPGATQSSTGIHTALGAVSSLTLADASALTGVAHVTATSPIISTTVQAVYSNQNKTTTMFGVYPIYQSIANWQMAEGTWFSDEDEATARPVAVLGAAVVQNLFGSSTVDPLGQMLRVNTQVLHIVGTLQAKGTPAD
ncbi:MAG TPA: ABC transporter permease, partial [Ktedonobacteraceae bacterium]|nr:ABC transporter permease [Ktedonobacteraceae bacterium]